MFICQLHKKFIPLMVLVERLEHFIVAIIINVAVAVVQVLL
jgi:hypothetical protein